MASGASHCKDCVWYLGRRGCSAPYPAQPPEWLIKVKVLRDGFLAPLLKGIEEAGEKTVWGPSL